jgi:hypothetical protein
MKDVLPTSRGCKSILSFVSKFKGSTLIVNDTVPITSNTAPVTNDTAPIINNTTPVTNDTTLVTNNTTPVVNDTTSIASDTTPVVNDTISIINDTAPITSDTTPIIGGASDTPMLHHEYGYKLPKIKRSLLSIAEALVNNDAEIDIISVRLVEKWKLLLQLIRNLNIEGIQQGQKVSSSTHYVTVPLVMRGLEVK